MMNLKPLKGADERKAKLKELVTKAMRAYKLFDTKMNENINRPFKESKLGKRLVEEIRRSRKK